MLLNVHSNYSLRYGTLSPKVLVERLVALGYEKAVITDINNSSGVLEFVKEINDQGVAGKLQPFAGMEFRNGDELCFIGIARNTVGFRELNELMTDCNLNAKPVPAYAPEFQDVLVVYPLGKKEPESLRENEYIGIRPGQLKQLWRLGKKTEERCVMLSPVTFENENGYKLHRQLRAIDHNLLLSQLQPQQMASPDENLLSSEDLLSKYDPYTSIITNTRSLLKQCSFNFDLKTPKNRRKFTTSTNEDKSLLEDLAQKGLAERYGRNHKEANERITKELEIIAEMEFQSHFLMTWDVIRFSKERGFYHVGRGSGANSVVAYCLGITDVCPIKLDLYFERFLNPKRKIPPDFDIDFSWKDRDEVLNYLFKKYGPKHTALLGAMNTFGDRSIVRELGKVYGLPKGEIDLLVHNPAAIENKHEIASMILSVVDQARDFPNIRSIHAGGVLISEEPITAYTALDLPPKGFPTAQIDMHTAEAIHFDKLDILSQRGIGHIKECAEIIYENKGININVHDVNAFMEDEQVKKQLKSADTIGCFYIESPAMRGLLTKLHCEDYLTLVAASSIIRPGVAQSGMMREYIYRFHNPGNFSYLHPVMEEQLHETHGVMVYQEDVLKVCHHFAGLDLADADVLRRMMSGKERTRKVREDITTKFFTNCKNRGYPDDVSREVWRQIESFGGFSFSKAHSASYAVESYQSLFLKVYYPLEFMTAVINNFGGFYNTRVYVNEARKAGATINLPCANTSDNTTVIHGSDIFLGFIHIQNLESSYARSIPRERTKNGPFTDLEDFVTRTGISLEQLTILIRIGALRFTGRNKKQLLWDAHSLLSKRPKKEEHHTLFHTKARQYKLPEFITHPVEDAYDEMELLGFTVSLTPFELLQTSYRGDVFTENLVQHIGKTIRMVGHYIAVKHVRTSRGDTMNFGTFIDVHNRFFDTVHFAPSLARSPFQGNGTYLIQGRVTEEFGFPSLEVDRMAKLPVKPDPRAE